MKIDWLTYNNVDHIMAWFLVSVMSDKGINKFGDFDSSALDVVLKVNDIEVDLETAMNNIQNQLTEIRERGKQEWFEELKLVILDNIENLFMEIKNENNS